MAISDDLLRQAVASISETEGLYMNPESLVEDVLLLAYAFPEEEDFMAACASTKRAFGFLISGKVMSSELKYDFEGWSSYHYQHRVGQGVRAACGIVFRRVEGGIEVKGFGHRHVPADLYSRLSQLRFK